VRTWRRTDFPKEGRRSYLTLGWRDFFLTPLIGAWEVSLYFFSVNIVL